MQEWLPWATRIVYEPYTPLHQSHFLQQNVAFVIYFKMWYCFIHPALTELGMPNLVCFINGETYGNVIWIHAGCHVIHMAMCRISCYL